jgi:hypothetical protein
MIIIIVTAVETSNLTSMLLFVCKEKMLGGKGKIIFNLWNFTIALYSGSPCVRANTVSPFRRNLMHLLSE